MSFGEVIGYTYDGAVYCCTECLPDGITEDHEEVNVMLDGQGEWDFVPCCDTCQSPIEDVTLTIDGNRYEAQRHLEAATSLWRTTEQLGNFVTRVIRSELLEHLDQAKHHIELL